MNHWTEQDLQQLAERGISTDQAQRQLDTLKNQPPRIQLNRVCTVGDGIQQIDDSQHATLLTAHQDTLPRWQKFVPASGAASRMFTLGSEDDGDRLCRELDQLALVTPLREVCRHRDIDLQQVVRHRQANQLLDLITTQAGLGYAEQPKALIPFHRYGEGYRTPFEEHLVEAVDCFGVDGHCRAHFTVSEQHRTKFQQQLKAIQSRYPGQSFDVRFSTQLSSTDTLALLPDDQPLRGSGGELVFRPGGHGALVENIDRLHADLVFIKNIDNIRHERFQSVSKLWIKLLCGYLARLDQQVKHCLEQLERGTAAAVANTRKYISSVWPAGPLNQITEPGELIDALDRPLRICGMVRNEGEPGGGPFWVHDAEGRISQQIVEGAEVASTDAQQKIYRQGTHFNPVFMALSLRDRQQLPFDMRQFIADERVIITQKTTDGVVVRVLERPGLWNGSMAHWNTVFVEVPEEVLTGEERRGLLRDEHTEFSS